MKWFRRIAFTMVALLALGLVSFVFLLAYDLNFAAKASDYTNQGFPAADGSELVGYLAMPEGEGLFPAVIMVHEWWGITPELIEMADRLAEQGYIVFAPDTYRGATTSLVPTALFLRLTVPEERVDSDMMAAYDYLTSLPQVDANKIGVLGFCYGGGVALRHAIENSNLAATVTLYGSTVSDPTAFGALLEKDNPVLGIFGAEDAQIPVAEVEEFEEALNEATIENTVTIYEGVGHAFVNPASIDASGAAAEAWAQILAFLNEKLKA
jgi:carboxymethylenebutenolidase